MGSMFTDAIKYMEGRIEHFDDYDNFKNIPSNYLLQMSMDFSPEIIIFNKYFNNYGIYNTPTNKLLDFFREFYTTKNIQHKNWFFKGKESKETEDVYFYLQKSFPHLKKNEIRDLFDIFMDKDEKKYLKELYSDGNMRKSRKRKTKVKE